MTKAMREMLDALNRAKEEAKALRTKDDVTIDEINAKTEEIKGINAKISLLQMEEAEDSIPSAGTVLDSGNQVKEDEEAYSDAFFAAIQGKRLTDAQASLLESRAALSSTTGEDGGYTIPTDEVVKIKELKRTLSSLEPYVNVEPVSTLTGSRVIEKDADSTPFTEFAEGADVPASDTPQFVQVSYAIKDRGGILPVPNNLLKDTKANISAHIRKWLAKKQVATRNSLILTLLNALAKVAITGIDDIKKILNVDLDPAISAGSIILTNQDGFNFLDTLKDDQGNYLMQDDVTDKTKKAIKGRQVVVLSNKTLATRDDAGTLKAPVIIGDLKEAITLFDREQMSLLSTSIGGTAFQNNRTDTRAITREDVKMVDDAAVKFGEVIVG